MRELKAHVYRLYPTPEQQSVLRRWIGAVRCVYNLALEQRRDWYRPGRRFSYATQCREITELRKEFDWMADVPVHALQQAAKDLDRAYQNWWAGRAHAPTLRKRGVNDTMRFPDPNTFAFRRLSKRLGEVKIPKLGWIRLRFDKAIPSTVKSITVSHRAGQWHVAAQYERDIAKPVPNGKSAVGIDRGIAIFAALSDGTSIAPSNFGKKALKALARAQQKLARKKRGSQNRAKQVRRVQKLHLRVSNARKDFLHKLSTTIVKNHEVVVIEKLEIRNMVRSAKGTIEQPGHNVRAKSGLNRSILDQGWGMFKIFLNYKLAAAGGQLVELPAHYTSQTCSECGVIDAASRKAQANFLCAACGHEDNADINAAINILRRWDTALLPVEATGYRAVEAGTIRRTA